jgi:hypothetical protein
VLRGDSRHEGNGAEKKEKVLELEGSMHDKSSVGRRVAVLRVFGRRCRLCAGRF